jgi:hypothetical protein
LGAGIADPKAKQKALKSFDKDLSKMANVGNKKFA